MLSDVSPGVLIETSDGQNISHAGEIPGTTTVLSVEEHRCRDPQVLLKHQARAHAHGPADDEGSELTTTK